MSSMTEGGFIALRSPAVCFSITAAALDDDDEEDDDELEDDEDDEPKAPNGLLFGESPPP